MTQRRARKHQKENEALRAEPEEPLMERASHLEAQFGSLKEQCASINLLFKKAQIGSPEKQKPKLV